MIRQEVRTVHRHAWKPTGKLRQFALHDFAGAAPQNPPPTVRAERDEVRAIPRVVDIGQTPQSRHPKIRSARRPPSTLFVELARSRERGVLVAKSLTAFAAVPP